MNDLLETWLPNVSMIWPEVWDATYENFRRAGPLLG